MSFTFQIPDRAVMKGLILSVKYLNAVPVFPVLSVLASEIPLRKLFL